MLAYLIFLCILDLFQPLDLYNMLRIQSFFTPTLAREAPRMNKPRINISRGESPKNEPYLAETAQETLVQWDITFSEESRPFLLSDLGEMVAKRAAVVARLTNRDALSKERLDLLVAQIRSPRLFSPSEESELERVLDANHGRATSYSEWRDSAMKMYNQIQNTTIEFKRNPPSTTLLLTLFNRDTVGKIIALTSYRLPSEAVPMSPTVESSLYREALISISKPGALKRYVPLLSTQGNDLFEQSITARKRIFKDSKFSEFLSLYPPHITKLFLENLETDTHARSQSSHPAPLYGNPEKYSQTLQVLRTDFERFVQLQAK
jgi:hypothetical protein